MIDHGDIEPLHRIRIALKELYNANQWWIYIEKLKIPSPSLDQISLILWGLAEILAPHSCWESQLRLCVRLQCCQICLRRLPPPTSIQRLSKFLFSASTLGITHIVYTYYTKVQFQLLFRGFFTTVNRMATSHCVGKTGTLPSMVDLAWALLFAFLGLSLPYRWFINFSRLIT